MFAQILKELPTSSWYRFCKRGRCFGSTGFYMKTIHTFEKVMMFDIRKKHSIKNLSCQEIKLNVVKVSQGGS